MAGLANPADLERAASQLERHAHALRNTKHDIARPTAGAVWQGNAADAFRTWVSEDAVNAESASGQLEAIARALRAAATQVRARIAAQERQARAHQNNPSAST